MLIKNKRDFYRLASQGLCGNTMRTWGSIDEYWPFRGKYPYVGIRNQSATGGIVIPMIHCTRLRLELSKYRGDYIISEVPRPNNVESTLQGELSWAHYALIGEPWAGLVLRYTHDSGMMRDALANSGRHAFGWEATRLMKHYTSPRAFTEITNLFDRYTVDGQYPVIEFSVFRKPAGINSRCLVIWEIRHY
jgi:hypothetical protein